MIKPPIRLLEGIANLYKDNKSRMLIHAATAGWTLVSIANIVGISTSKDLESKQKKYLVPQEIADSATNIGLFVLTTKALTWAADKLANNKNLIKFETVAKNNKDKVLKNIAASVDTHKDAVGGLKVFASLIGAVIASNIITPIIRGHYASWRQKSALKKLGEPLVLPETKGITAGPSLPFKNNMPQPINMNSFLAFTRNTGMRI